MLHYAASTPSVKRSFATSTLRRNITSRGFVQEQIPQRRFKSSNPLHSESPQSKRPSNNKKKDADKTQSHNRHEQEFPKDAKRPGDRMERKSSLTSSPLRRPNFLQKLRVGPRAQNAASSESFKYSEILKKTTQANNKFKPTFPSATQSNLQGSSKRGMESSNLVEFFDKRLEDLKTGKDKNRNQSINMPKFRSNARDSIAGNPQNGKPVSPFRHPHGGNRNQFGGLHAAKAEAQMAQKSIDRSSNTQNQHTNPMSVRDALDQSRTLGKTAASTTQQGENVTGANDSTTISPLRQFILDLQRRDKRKPEDGGAGEGSQKEPNVPSWRKPRNFSSQNQQKMVEPLFSPRNNNRQRSNHRQDGGQPKLDYYQPETKRPPPPKVDKPREIVLPLKETTLVDLSRLFGVKVDKLMSTLREMGEDPKRDDTYTVDTDMMEMIAMELDVKFTRPTRRQKEDNDHKQLMDRRKTTEESTEGEAETTTYQSLAPRPPVVCIMGHVDHGKTTLMDALRRLAGSGKSGDGKKKKSKKSSKGKQQKGADGAVAGTEAGGITQVISAFQVPFGEQKESITFLDTPGHAAFKAMRQSGSHAADILVLVVAADDGVSPQTVEIINFYKSILRDSKGGISMVVAMNKIDKPGINIEESRRRIENQLLEHGIFVEGVGSHDEGDYGTPVQFFPISAKKGDGLDDLIEGLALQSEIMDLRADDTARAEGIVMDARVEQGLGVVADCIIRWGSIGKSDVIVSGTHSGKVRILKDVNDKTIKTGGPSQPVRIIGFKTPPKAGDPIVCVASEEVADDLIARRTAIEDKKRAGLGSNDPTANFSQFIITGRESMTSFGTEKMIERHDIDLEDTGPIRIPIIVKAKADGSVAAVRDSLCLLGKESSFDIFVDTIAEGVGPLTRSDIEMAKESSACVFCFDVKNQDKAVLAMAETEGVKVMEYDVIYSLLDDAKELFMEYLPPVPVEVVHGKAAVQAVFEINGGKDAVAGLKVMEGTFYKKEAMIENAKSSVHFRVLRGGERVSPEGETTHASSLRKFKKDVDSVRNGEECGLGLSGFIDFKEGDIIECYSIEMKKSFA